jgi:hypothetical protein
MLLTTDEALAFVELHGIVLESARGPKPSLAEAVAGEPIRGSWWGHRAGRDIFAATRAVRDSPDVLVCRLLDGKVTYIHCRLWPAIVRLADKSNRDSLAAIRDEHTAAGSHRAVVVPFAEWLPTEVQEAADHLSEDEASVQVGEQLIKSFRAKS